MKTFSLIF